MCQLFAWACLLMWVSVNVVLLGTTLSPSSDCQLHYIGLQDVITCAKAITSEALAPIFLTSSVSGQGLELLRLFINLAPQRHQWAAKLDEPVEFIIDETFGVPGVGTVVAGTVKKGVLSINSPVLLGPDIRDGSFWKASIKSIHYKRLPVSEAVAGQTAALALKKVHNILHSSPGAITYPIAVVCHVLWMDSCVLNIPGCGSAKI
jgi:GTPase